MIDYAQNLIISELTNYPSDNILLLCDEHPLDKTHWSCLLNLQQLTLISNRYNQVQEATQNNINSTFNDFEVDANYDVIAFRISKEKSINHHLLAVAAQHLNRDGILIISGAKREGIKTLIKEAERYFSSTARISRGSHQTSLAVIAKQAIDPQQQPKQAGNYSEIVAIGAIGELIIYSKPGQYGWNQIDSGSQLLMDSLTELNPLLGETLDLGCGYGYLSLRALELNIANLTLTDNCAAAVASSHYNLERANHSIDYQIIAGDIAADIPQQFDSILCNPPYHLGFSTDTDLTVQFIAACKRLLKSSGKAYMAVNRFLPIEQMASDCDLGWTLLTQHQSFKVGVLESVTQPSLQ